MFSGVSFLLCVFSYVSTVGAVPTGAESMREV